MLADINGFYGLLEQFQDAALEAERWPALVERVCAAAGARGINIMAPADRGSVGGVLFSESMSAISDAYVKDGWNLRDHRAKFIPLIKRSGVTFESDFASPDDFRELEYYRFMAKYGFQHTAIINFSSGAEDLFFVLQRKTGDDGFREEDRHHFAALRSHLQMSSRIMALFSVGDIAGRLAAFERANIACAFFDRRGYVVDINQKAERLLTGDVQISRKRIRASSPRETTLFESLLSTFHKTAGQGHSEVFSFTRNGKYPLLARLERVGPHLRDIFAGATTMVLFEDVADARSISYDVLQQLFGLTLSECKIACLLNDGVDVRAISERCGIAYETARTHVRSILKKTGAERQAELCLLLAGIRLG